jgi:ribosomal protein S18 acetylase RimI-like enzyme
MTLSAGQAHEIYLRCFPEYPTSFAWFTSLLRPEEAALFCAQEDGAAAGYAMVHSNAIAVLCVLPEYRKHGHGSALLRQAEGHIKAGGCGAAVLGYGPHCLLQGVPDTDEGAVPFFQRRGYSADWTSVNMALPLADFDPQSLRIPAAPQGLAFRFAQAEDLPTLLRAVESAQPCWLEIFRRLGDAPVLLAEENGELLGFECLDPRGGLFVTGGTQVGSIGCVGVIPAARKRGVGRAMVAHGAAWLKAQGCAWTELRFVELVDWYRAIGFEVTGRQWMGRRPL